MEEINIEYLKHLESLEEKNLNDFLNSFRKIDKYRDKGEYLKQFFNKEILNILSDSDFIKCFYVDSQAKFINDRLSLNDLDILKTIVYYYNVNSREFKKAKELKEFEEKIFNEGYKKISHNQKELDGLKVNCYTEISKIGFMGSFDKREQIEGKLFYTEGYKSLMIIPKKNRTRGFIIKDYAYIKEVTAK